MNKCISILGSTGSIGTQALEVAEAHQISIHALAAGSNIELLEKQVRKYRPKLVCIYNEKCFPILKERLNDLLLLFFVEWKVSVPLHLIALLILY